MQPLVPLVFHNMPSLYPPSFRRNDFLYLYNNDEDDGFIYSPIECSSREMEGEDHDCSTNHDDFYIYIPRS